MTSDWWSNKNTRLRLNTILEKQAATQIEEINQAYRAAKIPGPIPKHWLGKVSRMNRLGRPLPKGLEDLADATIDENTRTFLESGKQAARDYFNAENASVRSDAFRKTQKKYASTSSARKSQTAGGINSGAVRRFKREKAAEAIVEAYKSALHINGNRKQLARNVAEWYTKNFPSQHSQRAIAQMLIRAGVAT